MELFGYLDRMIKMSEPQMSETILSQDKIVVTAADDLRRLSDRELVGTLDAAVAGERMALVVVLKCITEIESRGVHLDMGYRTMFDFCVLRLKMSEGAAIRRLYSARAAAKLPELFELLKTGSMSLSAVSRLAPHLTAENTKALIARATGARLREVETMVAELVFKEARVVPEVESPQAELTFTCTGPNADATPKETATDAGPTGGAEKAELMDSGPPEDSAPPVPTPPAPEPPAPEPPALQPQRLKRDFKRVESPGVIRTVFWAAPAFHEKLELAARLLGRHADGRIATVIEPVLDRFLDKEDPFRRKRKKRGKSTSRGRHVARWIRDEVWRRDGGRCVYTSAGGVRCEARSNLEYDHLKPWALGGSSDDPANIRLLCRAHNLHLARKTFGDRVPPARLT